MRDDVRALWLLMLLHNPIMEFRERVSLAHGSASTVLYWVHENMIKIDEKSVSFCSRRWLYCKEKSFGYQPKERISVHRLSPVSLLIAAALLELLSLGKDQEAAHKWFQRDQCIHLLSREKTHTS